MRLVIVPSTLALLPQYASIIDPVPDLRSAVHGAVSWLLEDGPAAVRGATAAAKQIGSELLGDLRGSGPGLLVVANGTATRTLKAPGHFDERAEGFDAELGAALGSGDFSALAEIDLDAAEQLWAPDAVVLSGLAAFRTESVVVDYDAAPYGVQYWVARYSCL